MYTNVFAIPFQVFFVIRLHSQAYASQSLPPIIDPDPMITCDLMDGRDAFLTMARDKHQEFSSLRRAKYSTLAMLYEIHNQGRDNFVYTCNHCKAHVETRWHCTVCEVSIFVLRSLEYAINFNTICVEWIHIIGWNAWVLNLLLEYFKI